MESLSPFTRRLVALGLLIVAVVSFLNLIVLPLRLLLTQSLTTLGDGRFQRAQIEATVARPATSSGAPVSPALYIAAHDRAAAAGQLEARIRADANTAEVQVLAIGQRPAPTNGATRLSEAITIQGEETALIAFINRIEQNAPLARLRSWRITRDPNGAAMRLVGQIDAAWGQP